MKTFNFEDMLSGIDPAIAGISQKTIANIYKVWKSSGGEMKLINPGFPEKDKKPVLKLISECIKEEGGEISRQSKILHLAMIYIAFSAKGRERFLKLIAHNFDVNIDTLDGKIHDLKSAAGVEERIKAEQILRDALLPPRIKLLRQLINLPNGFIFLKDMRSDLSKITGSDARMKKLSDDIKNILSLAFDVNLLELKELSWNSPASMLERLAGYEAVHEISSWQDLKHRLLTDRRVFAFFHYKMPDEPLIFVEVALVNGMSDNIQKLLDINAKPGDPKKADTAIFYSISSTQKGLEGISFGSFLIKRVVKKLSSKYPNLKTFATLSPVPSFITWLNSYLKNGGNNMFSGEESEKICKLAKNKNPGHALLALLEKESWHKNKITSEILRNPLMRLCAHFLFNVKQSKGLRAFDPVANFHLANGAKIEHINWLADISSKGLRQSAGIMINYHYRPDKIGENHENYLKSGKIHASSEARAWEK